jgi:hypothetical protein
MTDHINRRRWLLGSAGLAAALAGCGGGIDDDVRLRAVNATEDIDSIDIDYNDWTFAFDVRQGGDVTSYAQRQVLVIGAFGLFEVFRARDSLRLYDDNRSLPEGDTASVVVMGGRDAGIRLRLLANGGSRLADLQRQRALVERVEVDAGAPPSIRRWHSCVTTSSRRRGCWRCRPGSLPSSAPPSAGSRCRRAAANCAIARSCGSA